jgi:hypothetical protein
MKYNAAQVEELLPVLRVALTGLLFKLTGSEC